MFFKKILKRKHIRSTRVNLSNSRPKTQDQNNHIKSKSKPNMKLNSQLNQC